MYEVTILNDSGWAVEYLIDNKKISLSKRGCTIDIKNPESIVSFLCQLSHALSANEILVPFYKMINGHNLFQLLAVFFYEKALCCWQEYYSSHVPETFHAAFHHYFGFKYCINASSEGSRLFCAIREYSVGLRKQGMSENEVGQQCCFAQSDHYTVERISIDNNVCFFRVNNIAQISVCLSKRKNCQSAQLILTTLESLRSVLKEKSIAKLMEIISCIGAVATLGIANELFFDETISLISEYALDNVQKKRVKLQPRKIMKNFFGGRSQENIAVYATAISTLERLIPLSEEMLMAGNEHEIMSDKTTWSIFEKKNGLLIKTSISFWGPQQWISSVQDYCREKAIERKQAEKPYAQFIIKFTQAVNAAIKSLSDIGFSILSFHDLKPKHMLPLKSYLVEKPKYKDCMIKDILLNVRAVYNHEKEKHNEKDYLPLFSHNFIPRRALRPIQPISRESIQILMNVLKGQPKVIQLMFKLLVATGARIGSLCSLLEDDLLLENGKWVVHIFLWKTLDRAEIPELRIELPEALGEELQSFIVSTRDLRKQLDKPYIFVYQGNFRSGSARLPRVITVSSFNTAIKRCLGSLEIYSTGGFPISAVCRVLRASYGHELYLAGVSEEEAAKRMGNTPYIKGAHYTMRTAKEEAEARNKQYEQTIVPILNCNTTIQKAEKTTVMYGTCVKTVPCNNNNCKSCNQLVVCKKRKVM